MVETANHAQHAYFDSAIMLLFFLLCGRALDHAMRRKTRAVAGNLAALKAEFAHRFDGGRARPRAGRRAAGRATGCWCARAIACRPTASCSTAASEIDESLVTGETARRAVAAGAAIHAGAVNFSGALTMRVTAAGSGTLLDEVERLLEKAVTAKSRYVRLADRAARLYAPVVHATAALTVVGWLAAGASVHDAIVTAIAVLIITCPCALALAIPAVQVVASGALFRAGVILNSGDAIERLAEVDTVVFDKTGTLTLPEPRVDNAAAIDPELLRAGGAARAVEPPSARRRGRARGARTRAVRRRDRGAGARRARDDRRRGGAARQPGVLRRSAQRRSRSSPAPRPSRSAMRAAARVLAGAPDAAAGCGRDRRRRCARSGSSS